MTNRHENVVPKMACTDVIDEIATWAMEVLPQDLQCELAFDPSDGAVEAMAELVYREYGKRDNRLAELLRYLTRSLGPDAEKVHLSGMRSALRIVLSDLPKVEPTEVVERPRVLTPTFMAPKLQKVG